MSIFGSIVNKIFSHASAASAPATSGGSGPGGSADPGPSASSFNNPSSAAPSPGQMGSGSSSSQPASTSGSVGTSAPPAARTPVDVGRVLADMAAHDGEKLDWRHSIVDLLKLLNLDSSLSARQELARELSYQGSTADSAAMNVWLHKQVMQKLEENGGKVPDEFK